MCAQKIGKCILSFAAGNAYVNRNRIFQFGGLDASSCDDVGRTADMRLLLAILAFLAAEIVSLASASAAGDDAVDLDWTYMGSHFGVSLVKAELTLLVFCLVLHSPSTSLLLLLINSHRLSNF